MVEACRKGREEVLQGNGKEEERKRIVLEEILPGDEQLSGGNLNLKKSRLEITPGRKRAMGKTDSGILELLTLAKKTLSLSGHSDFTYNENAAKKDLTKVKLKTSIRLPKMSDQLPDVDRTDQSQERTIAKGRRD